MALAAWEVTQERTFARWCNQQLKHKNITIPDNGLVPAFKNGVNLCHLVEALSKESLKGWSPKPSNRFHEISNSSIALKYLKEKNIKLGSIGPEDITDEKRKLVMGLIWMLILHYQIAGGSSGDSAVDQAKSELLKWVQNQVKPFNTPVNNFTNDWSDGKVLCALVNSLKPDTINFNGLGNDGLSNAKQGIDSAETDLLIPRLLEPSDMANSAPDELSIITYVSQFRDAMNSGRFKSKPQASPHPVAAKSGGKTGNSAQVELFLSLATSSLKVKKDIQSMKFLLDKKGVKYLEYDVGTNEAKKNEAFQKSGTRVLPQLFIGGNYVGSYEDVEGLEECGQLNTLLNP